MQHRFATRTGAHTVSSISVEGRITRPERGETLTAPRAPPDILNRQARAEPLRSHGHTAYSSGETGARRKVVAMRWRKLVNAVLIAAAIILALRGATFVFEQPLIGLAHVAGSFTLLLVSVANGSTIRR